MRSVLEDTNSSIVLVLNKAIRLATICGESEWIDLFRAHKRGSDVSEIKKSNSKMVNPTTDSQSAHSVPFWVKELLGDRKRSDGMIHMASAFEIESSLKEIESLGPIEGDLFNLKHDFQNILYNIRERILIFTDRMEQYSISEETTQPLSQSSNSRVFIGHGNSAVWRDLKEFIQDRLVLPWG